MATPERLRILAADLSLRCPGFAILRQEKDAIAVERLCHLSSRAKVSHGETLAAIYQLLMEQSKGIDVFVRERAFARFPHETQALSKVTGIADLTAWQTAKEVYQEIAPTTVKKLLTGSGKADKAAVAAALESYVGPQTYATDDESDAVATGIAWSVSTGWIQSVSMSDDSRFLQSQPFGTNVDQEGSP